MRACDGCTPHPLRNANVASRTGVSAPVPDADASAYRERVERVESEATTLLAKVHKLEEQRQLLEFKNRVLTEMVCAAETAMKRRPPPPPPPPRRWLCHSWTHRRRWQN